MSSPMQDGLMWRCAACGERNFNHYENCVSCGRARLAGDPKLWQPEAVTVVSDRLVFKPRPVPRGMSDAVLAQILARLTAIDAGQTQLRAELMERLNALTEQMERHGKILDEILDRLPPR